MIELMKKVIFTLINVKNDDLPPLQKEKKTMKE